MMRRWASSSQLSQCWQDLEVKELSGSHGSGVAGSGRERAEQNLASVRRRISWGDSGSSSNLMMSTDDYIRLLGEQAVAAARS